MSEWDVQDIIRAIDRLTNAIFIVFWFGSVMISTALIITRKDIKRGE